LLKIRGKFFSRYIVIIEINKIREGHLIKVEPGLSDE